MEKDLERIPLINFEDEHLLVINKPAGMNTHAPAPFAGEGVYDWLRHREQRWSRLAILHRLDKETSGVLVFGKSPIANRSLTEQFTHRGVRKSYILVSDRKPGQDQFTAVSSLVRAGERYVSRPLHAGGERAETRFQVLETDGVRTLLEASPITGRTHQIRVHAADHGLPILGDTLYGGTPAGRLHLHAQELNFKHPGNGAEVTFRVPATFSAEPWLELRRALVDPCQTNAYRLLHGGSDGHPGWYVERLGDFILSQSESPPSARHFQLLTSWREPLAALGVYHKVLDRHLRRSTLEQVSPQNVIGDCAPDRFVVLENGMRFELSFQEGYSVGLFLDQRDNRRRLLVNHIAADFPAWGSGSSGPEVLNVFAYTCGFSVCAARAGARTTSLDLSKKYLEWGKRNFALNSVDPGSHDFIHGDALAWMGRWGRQKRLFDLILLDPPTFSRSREQGVFQAERDFGKLVDAALPLLRPGGHLFASTNAAQLAPEVFVETVEAAVTRARRTILQRHYAPQPPDFPVSRAEPGYLKTLWVRLS